MMALRTIFFPCALVFCALLESVEAQSGGFAPGARSLLDAHNCYPYDGKYDDRIDRALGTGLPVAIEQDLVWYTDAGSEKSWSIVSHGDPFSGNEPRLRDYFFERIRPQIEKVIAENNRDEWPMIVLNLDFKDSHPDHIREIWALLTDYESWLTTALRTDTPEKPEVLTPGPLLVLTGSSSEQERIFHDEVPVGEKLLVFGSASSRLPGAVGLSRKEQMNLQVTTAPEEMLITKASNYRRWWNNSWHVVEAGGAPLGGEWTDGDAQRLNELTTHAHRHGYWIRFYTINGYTGPGDGWSPGYNTRSLESARMRWQAQIDSGVDFIATDMYEEFSKLQHEHAR